MTEPPELITPEQAARALGVSPSGLRRLAAIYERVRDELPRQANARMWPREAVAELKQARDLVAAHKAPSIEAALRTAEITIDSGSGVDSTTRFTEKLRDNNALFNLLKELLNENRAMHEELRSLREEVTELRALPNSEPKGQERENPPEGTLWERFLYYWRRSG